MAHFYGIVDGSAKTEATRCGTKVSGLSTTAASWQGAIRTRIWHCEETGEDMCEVRMIPWQGAGETQTLYRGPIGTYCPPVDTDIDAPEYQIKLKLTDELLDS